jgi:hypothetical protein
VPPFEALPGPLVLRTTNATVDFGTCSDVNCAFPNFDFQYGPIIQRAPLEDASANCLGEAAYGDDITFELAASGGCAAYGFGIDAAEIEPAMNLECPVPGKVLNGSLDADSGSGGGWKDVSPSGSFVVINQGGGDYAGLLGITGGDCNTARVRSRIAPPTQATMAFPQLRFTTLAMMRSFEVRLSLPGATEPVTTTFTADEGSTVTHGYCLPLAVAGGVFPLEIEISGGDQCDQVLAGSVIIDDFEIVDAPTECP